MFIEDQEVLKDMLDSQKALTDLTSDELYILYKSRDITSRIFTAVESEILRRIDKNAYGLAAKNEK
jgi:hypothetical protein